MRSLGVCRHVDIISSIAVCVASEVDKVFFPFFFFLTVFSTAQLDSECKKLPESSAQFTQVERLVYCSEASEVNCSAAESTDLGPSR